MNLDTTQEQVVFSYINAVRAYANLCKVVEERPNYHLEVLMRAEKLELMSAQLLQLLEKLK